MAAARSLQGGGRQERAKKPLSGTWDQGDRLTEYPRGDARFAVIGDGGRPGPEETLGPAMITKNSHV